MVAASPMPRQCVGALVARIASVTPLPTPTVASYRLIASASPRRRSSSLTGGDIDLERLAGDGAAGGAASASARSCSMSTAITLAFPVMGLL